jgi:hypothetical protein
MARPCRRPRSFVGAVAIFLLLLSLVAVPAQASPSAAQRLVDAYSPIVMMGAQDYGVCDSSKEQYWPPTSVDVVLGNPRVRLLTRTGRKTTVITRAPTAGDLAGRGPDAYLDLPGSPLSPGCTYARAIAAIRRAGDAPAVTYAHLDREAGHTGLALQYWFYYYFNHFNDLHESDWEGMQITFPGDTPASALSTGPDEIVVFQHSGGEHADWDDSKVEKQGTHPVVYSAAGSHATFYSSALWLGNGQNGSGVGCDDTTGPLVPIKPRPVLVPDEPVTRGRFAWLSFTGRWGQREAGFNNGPAGPNTKPVWQAPFTWMDGTRSASPEVPGGALMGPSVANAFCGAVAHVTAFFNLKAKSLPAALGVAIGVLLVIGLLVTATTWRPVRLAPLHQQRAIGQLLLASGRLYWRHGRALMVIALSSLLIIGGLEAVEWLIRYVLNANGPGLSFGDSGLAITVSTPAGIGRTVAAPIVSAVVIMFVRNVDRQQDTGLVAAWSAVVGRLWRLLVVQLITNLAVIILLLTIIGIPLAVKKFIDWQLAQQEVIFEDRSIREALRGSTRIVHGHWWRTGTVAGILWLLSQIPGPALGFALLFTTIPAGEVNLVGAIVFVLLIPYVEIGRTLLYFDLKGRESTAPVPATIAIARS